MSIPSPGYKQLYQTVFDYVFYYKKEIKDINQKELQELFDAVLEDIGREFQVTSDFAGRQVQDISKTAARCIDGIFKSGAFRQISSSDQEKYKLMFQALEDELKAFGEIVQHKDKVDKLGLEHHLNTDWGWKQFEQLAKIGNPWAIQTLRKLIFKHDDKATIFLFRSSQYPLLAPLGLELKNEDYIHKKLILLLSKGQDGKKLVYAFIEAILKKESWPWGENILEERVKQDSVAAKVLWNIFKEQNDPSHFINRWALEQFSSDTAIGVEFIGCIFKNSSQKALSLATKLIDMALEKKNLHFDMLILAIAVMSDSKNEFLPLMQLRLPELERSRNEFKGCYQKILQALDYKKREISSSCKQDSENVGKVWNSRSVFSTMRIYQLFALREHQLIHLLKEGLGANQDLFQPIPNCFPQTAAVIVGLKKLRQYFSEALAQILAPHQIGVIVLDNNFENLRVPNYPNVSRITTAISTGLWIRDFSFVGQLNEKTYFQYPNWNKRGCEDLPSLKQQRILDLFPSESKKIKILENDCSTIAKVNVSQDQLCFFESILRIDPQLEKQRIQLTHNEGGNCLVGQSEGKPYVIIGKDALVYNRTHLVQRLAQLGFEKNKDGKWQLKDPYAYEEPNLTDEDMKYFFAKDFGVDPSRVHFIEQPDYHLDMAMCIIDDKTVALNDSLLVYEKSKVELEASLAKMEDFGQRKKQIQDRLPLLHHRLQKMKLFEDAAEKDLTKQGFKVIRFAGVFEDISKSNPENHRTNLFNYLSLTTPQNKRVIISLSCSLEQQNEFKAIFEVHCKHPVDHFYFLDHEPSEALLSQHGGIHCITKQLPFKL